MIQLALAFFGLSAMFMATGGNPDLYRWAPLVGLCAQPFWFVFAVRSKAWGLIVLSIAYSAVYVRGALIQWGLA